MSTHVEVSGQLCGLSSHILPFCMCYGHWIQVARLASSVHTYFYLLSHLSRQPRCILKVSVFGVVGE